MVRGLQSKCQGHQLLYIYTHMRAEGPVNILSLLNVHISRIYDLCVTHDTAKTHSCALVESKESTDARAAQAEGTMLLETKRHACMKRPELVLGPALQSANPSPPSCFGGRYIGRAQQNINGDFDRILRVQIKFLTIQVLMSSSLLDSHA